MLSEVRLISFLLFWCWRQVSDIRKREIPDGIPLLVTIVSLIPLESVQLSGLLVALPLLMIGATAGGIGGGDIKPTGACGLVLGFWENPDRTYHRASVALVFHAARQCVKRIKKRKSRKREGAGISACSFLAVGNAYKHSDWRLTMKKMFVIAGVLALSQAWQLQCAEAGKNMHRCEQMTRRNSE